MWSTKPPNGSGLCVEYVPTAMHAVVVAHVTPLSWLETAPAGFGVDWIDQLVPFHASASVERVSAVFSYEPTATHEVLDAHRMPESSLDSAPLGFGVVCRAQDVPF